MQTPRRDTHRAHVSLCGVIADILAKNAGLLVVVVRNVIIVNVHVTLKQRHDQPLRRHKDHLRRADLRLHLQPTHISVIKFDC